MKKNARRVGNTLRPLVGRAWAWAIQNDKGRWMLCNWAHPTKQALEDDGKPSPEARKVWVKLTANH